MADLEWQLSSHLICDNLTGILIFSSLLEIFCPALKILESITLINRTTDLLNVLDIELIEMT